MKSLDYKRLLPYGASIALFALLTVMVFSPIFDGKVIKQGDIVQFEGMAKEIKDYRSETGKEALWTNRMFGGMPGYQISFKSGNNVLKKVDLLMRSMFPHPVSLFFLSMLCFFFMFRVLKVNHWLSTIGAVSYAFGSYVLILFEAGHNSKIHAMAYMGPVLASSIIAFSGGKKNRLWGALLMAITLGFQIMTNHYQITFYTGLLVVVMGVNELIQAFKQKAIPEFLKTTGLLAISVVFAVLPSITTLWSTLEYGKETIRGGKSELTSNHSKDDAGGLDNDYATQWSYSQMETFNLILPNFKGGGTTSVLDESSNTYELLKNNIGDEKKAKEVLKNLPGYGFRLYHGEQPFTSGPVYIGITVAFLFLLAMFVVKSHIKWGLLAATILAFLLAWGRHNQGFFDLFFYNVPMFNKFRTPSMILVIAEVTLPLLGILGLHEIFKGEITLEQLKKKLIYSGGGMIALVLVLMVGMWGIDVGNMSPLDAFEVIGGTDSYMGRLEQQLPGISSAFLQDRVDLVIGDGWRAIVFIFLMAGVLYLWKTETIKLEIAIAVIGALVFFDVYSVGSDYLEEKHFVKKKEMRGTFSKSAIDKSILKDNSDFRVLNLSVSTFNDALTSYHHNSVGGYSAVKLWRYQDLIEHHISKQTPGVLNMLNMKYLIYQTKDGRKGYQRNPANLGSAWLIKNIKTVENADAEMTELKTLNTATSAVMDTRYSNLLKEGKTEFSATGNISLKNKTVNSVAYEYDGTESAFAVFSEIWYRGNKDWKAYIDGNYVDHVRVNYVLRGMEIPAGKHTIEFKFEPMSYYTGEILALIGSLLLIGMLAFQFYRNFQESKTDA